MQNTVIALTGLMASGKGAAKEYIEKKYGATSYKFSQILRDVLKRISVDNSRENMMAISLAIRSAFGGDVLAKAIFEDIKNAKEKLIVLDGARRPADLFFFEGQENFFLVSVESDEKVRYDRMRTRNENAGDSEKTLEQFLLDQEKETEREIPDLMKKAKYSLKNDGDLAELYRQIDAMMEQILN